MDKPKKTCFLITPLGELESAARVRADALCSEVLAPALATRALTLVRGDRIAEQGSVIVQVIREIVEAGAVIADLTGLNPNVLYELGLADAYRKPVLRMTSDPTQLPFNFRGDRTVTLRSTEDGRLMAHDADHARAAVDGFLVDALGWNHMSSSSVSEALRKLPSGFTIGGYLLANGWSGIEKALQGAGANVQRFRELQPTSFPSQYRVELVAALVSDLAEIHLSFGDWTTEEVDAYLQELVKALAACGSPYRLAVRHDDVLFTAEPGEATLTRSR